MDAMRYAAWLCSKNKDKKSESNSQLTLKLLSTRGRCVRRTKIKNLKAIHNRAALHLVPDALCSKNKDKKSESNSQLTPQHLGSETVVFEEQR